jgi:hypothetical protein
MHRAMSLLAGWKIWQLLERRGRTRAEGRGALAIIDVKEEVRRGVERGGGRGLAKMIVLVPT